MSHRDIFGTFPAPTPPKNDPTRLNYRLGLRYEMIKSQPISAEDKYKARMAAREQFTLDPKDVSTDQRSAMAKTRPSRPSFMYSFILSSLIHPFIRSLRRLSRVGKKPELDLGLF